MYNYPLFLSRFNETSFFGEIFVKTLKYQISWKTVQRESSCSMRTNRPVDISKLIVAFRNFANALGTIIGQGRNLIARVVAYLNTNKYLLNAAQFITYRLHVQRGTRWHSWLRRCATSRKVAGSIPDGVIGIFHWHNPSGRTVALGSTQPLTEMSTGNISWGCKGGRCVGLTTLPLSCADCLEIWEPQPPGTLRACPGL